MKKRASIIIANYEKPINLVKRALESALNQYGNFLEDIIIYDDGSAQKYQLELMSLVDKLTYSSRFKKIKLFCGSKQKGIAHARNMAITNSFSEFVMLLDSDDELKPAALATCITSMDKNIDLVFSDNLVIDVDNTIWVRKKKRYHSWHLKYYRTEYDPLIQSTYVVQCQLLRVKAFWSVGGYPENAFVGEHPHLITKLAYWKKQPNIYHVNKPLYVHRWSMDGSYKKYREEHKKLVSCVFLNACKMLNLNVKKVSYLARFQPYKVSHYQLIDNKNNLIRCPYLDYNSFKIIV